MLKCSMPNLQNPLFCSPKDLTVLLSNWQLKIMVRVEFFFPWSDWQLHTSSGAQVNGTIAQLEQRDCITILPTRCGKTLTFWIPLLFNNDGIIIIITALNILGDKNVAELEKLDINTVNITGDSATDELFKVRSLSFPAIAHN